MRKLWVTWLAVGMSLLMATPAYAVSFTHTARDARRDVTIEHSGFAGNQDIDIRKVHYQYYGYKSRYDLTIELTLRRVRPGLETAQLYTTEFVLSGDLFRVYGNDGGGGSLYLRSNGVWKRMQNCDVFVTLNPSTTLVSGTNVSIQTDSCWPEKRVKIRWTKTANYYSDSMTDLAAWDRVAVGKRIGKP
jgi:hypothetical protein